MYWFFIPLLIGILFTWASAFTAAYSRRWGERGGKMVTMILRNILGIPLWMFGLAIAWLSPAPPLFLLARGIQIFGLLLVVIGSVLVVWGHLVLGWPSHMPSVHDPLVRHSLYAYVRHPIYAGGLLIFPGLGLLRPTVSLISACTIGVVYLIIQARIEEIDLVQRLPAYRDYMKEVPRFMPRFRKQRLRNLIMLFVILCVVSFIQIMLDRIQPVTELNSFLSGDNIDLAKIKSSTLLLISKIQEIIRGPNLLIFEQLVLLEKNINLELSPNKFVIIANNLYKEFPNQSNVDALVKSPKRDVFVIPTKVGIQSFQ